MPDSLNIEQRLAAENRDLRARLEAAEEMLRAIRADEVDALVIQQNGRDLVRTLQGADQAYRTFVEVMSQGAATVAPDGVVLYCNRHFAELLRCPLEQAVGASVYDFAGSEDEGALRALMWEGLSTACIARSVRLRRRDGVAISVVLTATPLEGDGVKGLCLVLTDLTDREARVAAEAANLAKDRFLAALSHELRTPLSPVVMTVAAMELDTRLPDDVRRDLAMVRRNVELETRLIDDLLDLSRAITGKLRLRLEPVKMRPLVENVLEMVSSDANKKGITVRCKWTASVDRVHGDPARLQQMIWNVVKNAIKFSSQGGTIHVQLSSPDEQSLQLDVQDDGIGIDAEQLPRIFNAFEQGDATVAGQSGGLGLGLTIAKAVVEMHHGRMEAHSDGIGQGSTITMILPVTSLQVPAAKQVVVVSDDSPNAGVRVLLVEDHHDTAIALKRLLAQFGHDVKIADSVAAALQLVATESFDLVISDIGLPDGTGHDLMVQIKDRLAIPGVALTGYGMEDDVTRSREVGFVEHVVKPVDIAHLQAVINRVCGAKAKSASHSKN